MIRHGRLLRWLAIGGTALVSAGGCGSRTLQPALDGAAGVQAAEPARVLVLGVVHAQHSRNPNYSYQHVAQILQRFDPEVVCVEIRPQDFRMRPYLPEMMLATVWARVNNRAMCAFDWYEASARAARSGLDTLPEYVQKARLLDSLVAANPVTSRFEKRYGDYWSGAHDYHFYNGAEYNRYFEEWYRLSLSVYGDSPVNLNYETRNRRMMQLAWASIDAHPGRRIILLTGAEHKHYFDRELKAHERVQLVALDDLPTFDTLPLEPAVRAFLDDADDLLYYASGFPADTNRYYRGKLVGLVHGPDMDEFPEIIPERNVAVAARVMARWRASQAESDQMNFDDAWIQFLNGSYASAITLLVRLTKADARTPIEDPFLRVSAYRNLGFCYDVLGKREDALRAYATARQVAKGTRFEPFIDRTLKSYETVPFRRAPRGPE